MLPHFDGQSHVALGGKQRWWVHRRTIHSHVQDGWHGLSSRQMYKRAPLEDIPVTAIPWVSHLAAPSPW